MPKQAKKKSPRHVRAAAADDPKAKERFEEMYAQAKAHYDEHGNYDELTHVSLLFWIRYYRYNIRDGKIRAGSDLYHRLQAIGISGPPVPNHATRVAPVALQQAHPSPAEATAAVVDNGSLGAFAAVNHGMPAAAPVVAVAAPAAWNALYVELQDEDEGLIDMPVAHSCCIM